MIADREQLKEADILVVLLSADYASNAYCQKTELPFVIEQKKSGSAAVYFVNLRPHVIDQSVRAYQILPSGPVTQAEDRDVAFSSIVNQIGSDLRATAFIGPQPQTRVAAPTRSHAKPGALELRLHPKDGLSYVWIPPGQFRMGASKDDKEAYDDEKPAHDVRISKGFWMCQTPVTVAAYKRYVRDTGGSMPAEPIYLDKNLNPGWKDESLPMTMVSWEDAQGYCKWAGLRLPTEAEWEYAGRAGTTGSRYGALDEIGWYADNSGNKRIDSQELWNTDSSSYGKRIMENGNRPRPAGQKQPNGFHLYDMLGNVWEWTEDWFDDSYYKASPAEDPKGPASGSIRVLRGGSWGDVPRVARASFRIIFQPDARYYSIGFRCSGEKLVP